MKRSRSLRAELRRSPAKAAVLLLTMGFAFLSWSQSLFGEEEAPAWASMPIEAGNRNDSPDLGNPAASAEPAPPAIQEFSAALERIESWQNALANQSLPAFDLAKRPTEPVGAGESSGSLATEEMENISEILPPIDLSLSGTAIFGDSRFSLFGQERVQEGQRIGRYVVKAIRSREVDLLDGERLFVLRMADPELLARVTQSTEK